MEKKIAKIALADLSYERFVNDYLLAEKPVLITDIANSSGEEITPAKVHEIFGKNAQRSIGWYDAPLMPGEKYAPSLVRKVFAREDMSIRPLPMRIFMQPHGHRTLYHYDGNSLHGFNLQMKGRKRWKLISPHTPVPSVPFMFVSLVGKDFQPSTTVHEYDDFETKEGEMLFLPRYWIHSVETLEEENINFNWVCTPRFPNLENPLGRRECALLLLRKKIPLVNRFLVDAFHHYGGSGEAIIEKYIADIGYIDLFLQLGKEMGNLPKTLMLAKEIKAMAAEFGQNNFNL
jgi:hypothetical protein